MKVIVDAGPIIELSRLGHVHLLREFFAPVVVPQEVAHEVAGPGETRPGADFTHLPWVDVQRVDARQRSALQQLHGLDVGEAATILLALKAHADGEEVRLLVDDARAVRAAIDLKLLPIRTGALLLHSVVEGALSKA